MIHMGITHSSLLRTGEVRARIHAAYRGTRRWWWMAALLTAPVAASGQDATTSGPQRASRADLLARATDLEQQVAARKGKDKELKRAAAEASAIRARLEKGDFRVGDQFLVTFRLDSVRSESVLVRDSLKVALLNLPDVSLAGVLRSELNDHMGAHVSRYLRNAELRASVLTRVAILGAVARPGFYYAAPDRPLSDLVMMAGGPAPNANLNELEVSRDSKQLIKSKDSRQYLKDGRTLEQLDIQSGDEVRVPQKRKINWQIFVQLALVLSTLTFAFINFLQWYYNRQDQ